MVDKAGVGEKRNTSENELAIKHTIHMLLFES